MRKLVGIASVFAILCMSAPSARADAWKVAEKVIPGGMVAVIKIDVKDFRDLLTKDTFRELLDDLDVDGLVDILEEYGVDSLQSIDQIVIAVDERMRGVLFASGPGLPDKLMECMKKSDYRDAKMERTDNMITFTESRGDDVAAYGVYGDTVVTTRHLSEREYKPYMPGRGVARDAILARALNRIDRKAPAFAVFAEPVELEEFVKEEISGKLKYAVAELKGTSKLTVRAIAVAGDPAALVRAADTNDLKEAMDKIGATYTVKSDAEAAEMTVSAPRTVLKKVADEILSWMSSAGRTKVAQAQQR